jgi:protein involved in polysaccharide export with SLBB domain
VFGYRGANFVSAQSPAPRANRSEPSHVLVPRELVQIKVFQEPDLDTAVRMPGDGHINSPLIGEVALAGQRIQQATRAIHDRLQARFLVNPQVSIAVLEPAMQLFTVLGQVQRPGTYRFPEQQDLDVLQELQAGIRVWPIPVGAFLIGVSGSEQIIRLDGKRMARGEIGEPFQ